MKKQDSDGLVSRLKIKSVPAQSEDKPPSPAIIVPEPKAEPTSVLTPKYLIEKKVHGKGKRTCQCDIPVDLRVNLPNILQDASPFSLPLHTGQLVDLVYCEVVKSVQLQERLIVYVGKNAIQKNKKRTSIIIADHIDEYLKSFLSAPTKQALSWFVAWILSDWEQIRPMLTYNGLGGKSEA